MPRGVQSPLSHLALYCRVASKAKIETGGEAVRRLRLGILSLVLILMILPREASANDNMGPVLQHFSGYSPYFALNSSLPDDWKTAIRAAATTWYDGSWFKPQEGAQVGHHLVRRC